VSKRLRLGLNEGAFRSYIYTCIYMHAYIHRWIHTLESRGESTPSICFVSRNGNSSGTGRAHAPLPKAIPKSIPISNPRPVTRVLLLCLYVSMYIQYVCMRVHIRVCTCMCMCRCRYKVDSNLMTGSICASPRAHARTSGAIVPVFIHPDTRVCDICTCDIYTQHFTQKYTYRQRQGCSGWHS